MPMARLDFSFEKRLSKKIKLTLYGKVNNILNTALVDRMYPAGGYNNYSLGSPYYLSNQSGTGQIGSIIVENEKFGQSYLLGLRYKF